MTTAEKILHKLLDFRYATPFNLYSDKAKTQDGAVLQVSKSMTKLLKAGYIEEVGYNVDSKERLRKQFYKITLDGAEFVNRKEDFKKVEKKASSSVKHESMKIDTLNELGVKSTIDLSYQRCYV